MIRAAGLAIVAAVCSFVLSELGFKGKKLFSIISALLLFSLACDGLSKILADTSPFFEGAGLSEAAKTAAKVVGAGYLFGICADILTELSEPILAKGLMVFGKVEILVITLPYLLDIIKMGLELIG